MTRYMWNFLIGGLMIIGGLSGRFVLIGTSSGPALAALGAAIVALGGYRLAKARGAI
jgi:hypothetical protein